MKPWQPQHVLLQPIVADFTGTEFHMLCDWLTSIQWASAEEVQGYTEHVSMDLLASVPVTSNLLFKMCDDVYSLLKDTKFSQGLSTGSMQGYHLSQFFERSIYVSNSYSIRKTLQNNNNENQWNLLVSH